MGGNVGDVKYHSTLMVWWNLWEWLKISHFCFDAMEEMWERNQTILRKSVKSLAQ
jgi:hypothetical protein